MKTTLHRYSFNIRNASEDAAYHNLFRQLKDTPGRGRWLNAIATPGSDHGDAPEGEVELDTEFFFNNQWNTKCGHRVFDWYEGINLNNRNLKFGHYLDITQEMIDLRNNTLVCGYTWKHFPISSGLKFNTTDAALGSPYLKEEELYLVRLHPVSYTGNRAKLTAKERDLLLPQYVKAQTQRLAVESKKRVANLHEEYAEAVLVAEIERDGFLWLIEHGINTENIIFYKHTKRFGVGWRHPLSPSTEKVMVEKLSGFPFQYDIDGGKS